MGHNSLFSLYVLVQMYVDTLLYAKQNNLIIVIGYGLLLLIH